ncbi:sodium:proton antiporter [Alloscardovia macacae]|uniref:Sodium:proton antiporter n=1 Tax=Alloscardovia macacae TaxID=1160091 RepID=A0A1Y2SYT7_9BIFI|nr:Na+/H+ antiporter NhaC family protein [Alloscardovia macacae]OTA27573.1 sodium:proton antiporter [Alloscardovia macacae]OTA30219.1 sodium:proton antiporter [Alloscardovia macacae]
MTTQTTATVQPTVQPATQTGGKPTIRFYGGPLVALLPLAVFLGFCIEFFVVLKAFDMGVLAMAALSALLVTALFVRTDGGTKQDGAVTQDGATKRDDRAAKRDGAASSRAHYWNAVYAGVREATPIVILLLAIGMFSQLIKSANLSGGFLWIAQHVGVSGGLLSALIFLFVCIIATATGSSLGTMFTAFPIFYPAGVLLGAHPAFLAAAIVGGAIFGDNLAPISDTTIISASTQHYSGDRRSTADVGGAVRTRFKYSAVAGTATFLLLALFGGSGSGSVAGSAGSAGSAGGAGMTGGAAFANSAVAADPKTLLMLLPVALMLGTVVLTKDLYLSIILGILSGAGVGLAAGILGVQDIVSVKDGAPAGFLFEGVNSMMSTVILVIAVYGIMGVLQASGLLDALLSRLGGSRFGASARGTELIIMVGITVTTLLFGGVTSASMTTFGKVCDGLGQRAGLHPYRRANLLDGFANGLAVCIPFLSVFVFIGSSLTSGYAENGVVAVSVVELSAHMVYPALIFLVLLGSVLTGWGRIYERGIGE